MLPKAHVTTRHSFQPLRAVLVLVCLLATLALGAGGAEAQSNNCTGGAGNPCTQITNLDDYAFGSWNGIDDMVLTQRHCVRVSGNLATPGLLYDVTITAVGAVGGNLRFTTVPVGFGGTLPYSVTYANADGTNSSTITANGGAATGFAGITRANQTTCQSNDATLGQRLTITISAASLAAAAAGSYSGTLQVVVAPQ